MKFNSKNSAVLVIDLLEEFVHGNEKEILLPKNRSNPLIKNIKKLCDKAREKNVPVIHVHCLHLKGEKMVEKAKAHAIKGRKKTKQIKELDGLIDFTVHKKTYDGFYKTKLEKLLKKLKVKNLIVSGIQSDCCVIATCFSALFRDFNVIIVKECVETRTRKRQKVIMERLNKLVGKVISLREINFSTNENK
jgi:nicotinamidase-related amidase